MVPCLFACFFIVVSLHVSVCLVDCLLVTVLCLSLTHCLFVTVLLLVVTDSLFVCHCVTACCY